MTVCEVWDITGCQGLKKKSHGGGERWGGKKRGERLLSMCVV